MRPIMFRILAALLQMYPKTKILPGRQNVSGDD
jgi:hypothetical protein